MGVLGPNVRLLVMAIAFVAIQLVAGNDNLRVAYQWNQIDYEFPGGSDERAEAIRSGAFVPANVIPVGLEVYKKRLFLTLPRWKPGIPASLAYININDTTTQSPKLRPYPSWNAHRQMGDEEAPEIVSPFRIRADRCGRLWVLDTGVSDLLGDTKVLAPTSLLVYDLHNDNLLRRFKFPADHIKESSFYANIAVEDTDCDDTFAYAASSGCSLPIFYSLY